MASPIFLQSTVASTTLYLEAAAGGPALGLTFSDVVVQLRKASGSPVVKTLTSMNFIEYSDGFYNLVLTTGDTGTLGSLDILVSGATIQGNVISAQVAVPASIVPVTTPAPATVNLFGFVFGPDALPLLGASVVAKVLGNPTVLHPGSEGLGIATGIVSVKTDANGYFTLPLIAGVTVQVFIPVMNYKRDLTVPSSSANLFDIV